MRRFAHVGASLILTFVLAGCGGDPEPDVEVGMTEYAIYTERELPAGRTVWRVFNEGATHHSLSVCPGDLTECTGENVEMEVVRKPINARDPDSLPDATDALVLGAEWDALVEIGLEPGTYRLWCGVPNHAPQGMQLEVTVVEPAEQ